MDVKAETKIPIVVKASGEIKGEGQMKRTTVDSSKQRMTYSNAHRLHRVRQEFYSNNKISLLSSKEEVSSVKVGEFVEFSADFSKSEFADVLDLLSPEMGGVIAYNMYLSEVKKTSGTFDQSIADNRVMTGKAIVETIQKEFRNDLSSEYYAQLTDNSKNPIEASAVIVCDKQFFSNNDTDRLMDGTFTVFGKVISTDPHGKGFSKFERNKLLKRIKPEGAKWLQGKIKEWKDIEQYFDTEISLTTTGTAIKVIPIAIYA